MSVEDAVKAAQQGHRNYAKRQMTWFRREPEVHWIAGFGDEAETVRAAKELIAEVASTRAALGVRPCLRQVLTRLSSSRLPECKVDPHCHCKDETKRRQRQSRRKETQKLPRNF